MVLVMNKILCRKTKRSVQYPLMLTYGDVNFLGYHAAGNTVMRIADAKVAGELLDMMSNK